MATSSKPRATQTPLSSSVKRDTQRSAQNTPSTKNATQAPQPQTGAKDPFRRGAPAVISTFPHSTVHIQSTVLSKEQIIPLGLVCQKDISWLPIRWGPVPSRTRQIALYSGYYTTEESGGVGSSTLGSALLATNLDPKRHKLTYGEQFPYGVAGYWGEGEVCPEKREGQTFFFRLYALPKRWPHFGIGKALARLDEQALAVGELTASYGPP